MDGSYSVHLSLVLSVRPGFPLHIASSNALIEYFSINSHGEYFDDFFLDKEKTHLTLYNHKNVVSNPGFTPLYNEFNNETHYVKVVQPCTSTVQPTNQQQLTITNHSWVPINTGATIVSVDHSNSKICLPNHKSIVFKNERSPTSSSGEVITYNNGSNDNNNENSHLTSFNHTVYNGKCESESYDSRQHSLHVASHSQIDSKSLASQSHAPTNETLSFIEDCNTDDEEEDEYEEDDEDTDDNNDTENSFENIGLSSKLYEVDMLIPQLNYALSSATSSNQWVNHIKSPDKSHTDKKQKQNLRKRKREASFSEVEVLADGEFMCRWPKCREKVESSDALVDHFKKHTGETDELLNQEKKKKVNYYSLSKLSASSINFTTRKKSGLATKVFEYECSWPDCGLGVQTKDDLVKHIKLHTGEKSLPCKKCDFEAATSVELISHMDGCHPLNVTCTQCSLKFSSEKDLKLHMRYNHEDDSCMKGKNGASKSPKNKKPKPVLEPNSFLCEICAKSFNYRSHLKKHVMRVHNINPIRCELCSVVFKNEYALKNHREQVHKFETIMCEQCGKYYKKNKIKTHIQVVHERSQTVKCDWPDCNQIFTSSKSYKVHLRRHTGDKRLKCEHCEFAAIQRTSMNYHMQKHHPEIWTHHMHRKTMTVENTWVNY